MCICVFAMTHMWEPEGLKIGSNTEFLLPMKKYTLRTHFHLFSFLFLHQPSPLCLLVVDNEFIIQTKPILNF